MLALEVPTFMDIGNGFGIFHVLGPVPVFVSVPVLVIAPVISIVSVPVLVLVLVPFLVLIVVRVLDYVFSMSLFFILVSASRLHFCPQLRPRPFPCHRKPINRLLR